MRSADMDGKYDYPNVYGSCLSDGYSSISECSTSFVKCENGVPELFECTDDKVFDRISGQCIESYESDECSTFSSEKDEEVAVDKQISKKMRKSVDENIYSCLERMDGLYSLGCESQFLTCSGGVSRVMRCPVDLFYNNVTDACDYPANVIGCSEILGNNVGGVNGDGVCAGVSSAEWFEVDKCSSLFFTCRQGEKVQLACPSRLIFSAATLRCEYSHDVMGCRETSEQLPEIFADPVQPSSEFPNEGLVDSEKLPEEPKKSPTKPSVVEKSSGKSSSEPRKAGKLPSGSKHSSSKAIDESKRKSPKKTPSSSKKPVKDVKPSRKSSSKPQKSVKLPSGSKHSSSKPVDESKRNSSKKAPGRYRKPAKKMPKKFQRPSHQSYADSGTSGSGQSSGTASDDVEKSSGTSFGELFFDSGKSFGGSGEFSGEFEESSGTSSGDFEELSGELFADSQLLEEFEESSGSISFDEFGEFSGTLELEETSGDSSGESSMEIEGSFDELFADSAKAFEFEESSGHFGSGESSGESFGLEAIELTETSGNELLLDFSGSQDSTLLGSGSSGSGSDNSFSSDNQTVEVSDLLATGATDCTDQPDGFYGQGCSTLMVACKDGLPTPMTCPAELKYNSEKQICDLPANVAACSQEVSNEAADELLDFDTAIDNEISNESSRRMKRFAIHSHKHNEMAKLLCHNKKDGRTSLGCEESFLTCHRGRGHVMECKKGKTLDESLQRCVPLELHPTCFQRVRPSEKSLDQVAVFDVNAEQESIESSGEGSGEIGDRNRHASHVYCEKDGYFAKTICAPDFIHCYHGKPCEMMCDYGFFYSSSVQMCLRAAEMPECIGFLAHKDY